MKKFNPLFILFFSFLSTASNAQWESYVCVALSDPYPDVESACQRYRDYKSDPSISCEINTPSEEGTFSRTINGTAYQYTERTYYDATRDSGAGSVVGSFYCYSASEPEPTVCTEEGFNAAYQHHCVNEFANEECVYTHQSTFPIPEEGITVPTGEWVDYVCTEGCTVQTILTQEVVSQTNSEYTFRDTTSRVVTTDDCEVPPPDTSNESELWIFGTNSSAPDGSTSSSPDGTYSPGGDTGTGDMASDIATVVENTAATTRNLTTINSSLEDGFEGLADSLDNQTQTLEELIGETNSLLADGAGVSTDLSGVESRLDTISSMLDSPQTAQPSGGFFALQYPSIGEAVNGAFQNIVNSDLGNAALNAGNMFTASSAVCPAFSFDLGWPINSTIATDIHCTLWEQISPTLSACMMVIYSWLALRIFLSA
ncbi:MAG: hypothetical protein P1U47_11985 [Zhongshania sp.]|uniref:hypothetical protein n=1 Tax=Zhongshania sp. TaxID=1971902 RepID=UPI002637FAFA|nr:hypothetical protein [Zhongshania sp.]MDF1693089.1 hypothetical protein [Zhongshania sp.]